MEGEDGGWRRRGGGKHWATKGGLLYALRLSDTKSIQQEHQLHPSCKLTLQQGQDKHLNLIYNRKRHAKKPFPNLPYKSRKHIAARMGTSTNWSRDGRHHYHKIAEIDPYRIGGSLARYTTMCNQMQSLRNFIS